MSPIIREAAHQFGQKLSTISLELHYHSTSTWQETLWHIFICVDWSWDKRKLFWVSGWESLYNPTSSSPCCWKHTSPLTSFLPGLCHDEPSSWSPVGFLTCVPFRQWLWKPWIPSWIILLPSSGEQISSKDIFMLLTLASVPIEQLQSVSQHEGVN